MAEVELRLDPVPTHVRTARQVAVALARRAGLSAEALDEVRLAVGEACGLAVALHQRGAAAGPVIVIFEDGHGLAVQVRAAVPLVVADGEEAVRVLAGAVADSGGEDALPPAASLAVLAELAPHCAVATGPTGPRIDLAWPAA